MFCKYCGTSIDIDAVFCPKCGKNQNLSDSQYDSPHFNKQDEIYQKNNQNRPPISVGFVQAIKNMYINYANFNGRAVRSEYWWVYLYNMLITVIVMLLPPKYAFLGTVWSIVHLIPGIALCVRRLHDVGKSGAFWFAFLIPIVGPIMVIYQLCKDSSFSDNIWGLSPYNISHEYDETKTWKCEKCGCRTSNSYLTCKNCGETKPASKPLTPQTAPQQKSKKCVCGEIVYGNHCPNCGREM